MSGQGLNIKIFDDRKKMGKAAAEYAAKCINKCIMTKGTARVIFASAPSQDEMLYYLAKENIDWSKVVGFHMDEYCGLEEGSPQLFSEYIKKHLFDKVPIKQYYLLQAWEYEKEVERYGRLLEEDPIDVCCMGIGENGHIAFNDPQYADFKDKQSVKIVELDEVCRQQQVHDGCFETIEDVPKTAVTITIPMLVSAEYICCTVPGINKYHILKNVIDTDMTEEIPATILKSHQNCLIFTDQKVI